MRTKTSWIVQIDVPLTDTTDEIENDLFDILGMGASAKKQTSDELSNVEIQNWFDARDEAESIVGELSEYAIDMGLNFDVNIDRIDYV